jgi:hypothetical protein
MGSANVRVEALITLRSALLQFKSDARNALRAMNNEGWRAQKALEEREEYWKRELRRRLELLQQARIELGICQSIGGNCAVIAMKVRKASIDVNYAREQLRIVQFNTPSQTRMTHNGSDSHKNTTPICPITATKDTNIKLNRFSS